MGLESAIHAVRSSITRHPETVTQLRYQYSTASHPESPVTGICPVVPSHEIDAINWVERHTAEMLTTIRHGGDRRTSCLLDRGGSKYGERKWRAKLRPASVRVKYRIAVYADVGQSRKLWKRPVA